MAILGRIVYTITFLVAYALVVYIGYKLFIEDKRGKK